MDRSMDPEAMRLPVGSNLAAKISPEWPDSSITGAWRALVRGAVWIRAPLLPVALVLVRARLEPRLGLLTSCWPPLGSSEAGLFSADMMCVLEVW